MTDKERIDKYAERILRFDAKKINAGGYKLTHEPCSYALVIKYLMYTKDMTYKQLGAYFNNITAQGINHLLNRTPKDRYSEEDIDKYCNALKVKRSFFIELCDKVEELMEQKNLNE